MTPQDFVYWLNGFVELNKGKMPDEDQWKSIQEHLKLVFTKVTPPVGDKLTLPSLPPVYTPTYPTFPGYPGWKPPYEVTCKFDGLDPSLKTMTFC